MAQKQSSILSQNASSDKIQRTAINPDGNLGSFYDGYREDVSGQLAMLDEDKSNKLLKTTQCILVNGKADQYNNLLQLINMPIELRMSVLLNLVSRKGIVSIIDYPHHINEYTRFLYYSYIHQEERVSDKITKIQKSDKSPIPSAATTHIITGVNYGIDVVVVLQLPSENNIGKAINNVLKMLCACLNSDQSSSSLIQENTNLLGQITDTTVYSNIPCLMKMSTVQDVCSYIDTNKSEPVNYPIMYTLRPIQWMFPQYTGPGVNFTSTPSAFREKVEQYLLQFSDTIERLKHSLDTDLTPILCGNLDEELGDAQVQLLCLKKTYNETIQRFHTLIFEIRKNRSKIGSIDQTLIEIKDKTSKDIEDFTRLMEQLDRKKQLLISLKKQKFIYCNAVDRHVSEKDNDQTLARKLTINNRQSRILCSNDRLNKKNPEKCTEQRRLLAEEHKVNSDLDIIYADFSYCTFELGAMIISTSSKQKTKEKITVKKSSLPSTRTQTSKKAPSSSSLMSNDVINILLLGETGVGKSTFINAFVNYLTSETFERAQSNEPVVLIPVSFLMTIGDDFQERTIKFGDFVSSHNEDFEHPGESVTQHCKSYEFHLNRSDGKKLCIIDTPGFGDTRGLNQDDLNMQDILEYINNLTHLNAVCFLLKPNSSELHTFFRMCFTQLIDLLGPDVRQNIIFCFTNARSTFYMPGDTAHLLKAMLKSPSFNDIPFKKENVFCFDNESFRYLVALRNSIQFNGEEEHDYKMSWSISVNESNRLIGYICTQLAACSMDNEWKSNKRAEIAIYDMIRPMLEAMRNLIRNIILCEMESPNKSIKLCAKAIHRPATICSVCTPYPIKVGKFWIVREITHESLKKCLVCPCTADQHIAIDYLVRLEDSNSAPSHQPNEMTAMVERLCFAGAKFDYFLSHIVRSSKGDPFSMGLIRMIDDEGNLCENQKPNRLNLQLLNRLKTVECQYKERIADLKSVKQETALLNIHELIAVIRTYPMVEEQLDAIKETQKMMAEPYEVSPD